MAKGQRKEIISRVWPGAKSKSEYNNKNLVAILPCGKALRPRKSRKMKKITREGMKNSSHK